MFLICFLCFCDEQICYNNISHKEVFMPNPIKGNLNFEVCNNVFDASYTMQSMMACQDYYEIGMTISGDRKVIMPDHIHYLHKGIVATTPMNVYLRTTPASNQTYERIMVKYKPAMAADFIAIAGQKAFDDINFGYIHTFTQPVQEEILLILQHMSAIYDNYNNFTELLLKGFLNQLLYIIHTKRLQPKQEEYLQFHHTNPIIVEALYYMENSYQESPSLLMVAQHLNVSREHLSRLFKHTVGISFSEYQNRIRLRHAVEYLENTNYTVEKISELSGFSNSNYMCDVFKKYYQTSPSQHRKTYIQRNMHNQPVTTK